MKTDHLGPDRTWCLVTDDPKCVSTAGRKPLAELKDHEFIDCNTVENSRLIAAAPDLLQALEFFIQWDRTGEPVSDICFAHARRAIDKATARS